MKPLIFAILFYLAAATRSSAHIGSPNVFFDGKAGAHSVRVVIRPPPALPGIAQVDIRTEFSGSVTARAVMLGAGEETAAPAVAAEPVPGGEHLLHVPLWLMRAGNYDVLIQTADGGMLHVPLRAASLVPPVMPAGLGAVLGALGIFLLGSAAIIAGAAARESTLALPVAPTATDRRRGILVLAATLLLLSGGVAFATARWRKMDADFRANSLVKPLPVAGSIRTDDGNHILTIQQPRDADVTWASLVTDHGKLMHLFLVENATGLAFAHLHPVRIDYRTFESTLPAMPAGTYTLYGETTHESGSADTVTGLVTIPAPLREAPQAEWTMANEAWCQSPPSATAQSAKPGTLDADDSWHVGPATATRVAPLMGGAKMIFHTPGTLAADRETILRFTIAGASGEPIALQTYMGMAGHCVIRKHDGSVFTHLHPAGSISMAAQQLIDPKNMPSSAPIAPADEITFPYAFPNSGDYRIWVQIRAAGRVLTGVFDVAVQQ
jgi:hypothetical protein